MKHTIAILLAAVLVGCGREEGETALPNICPGLKGAAFEACFYPIVEFGVRLCAHNEGYNGGCYRRFMEDMNDHLHGRHS